VFYVQSLGSTGTAQITTSIVTSPNPGYLSGSPLNVTLVPTGLELSCSLSLTPSGTCSSVGSRSVVSTTNENVPSRFLLATQTTNPANLSNNRTGNSQQVRGGFTLVVPLSALPPAVGRYLEGTVNGTLTATPTTSISIPGGSAFGYVFVEPNAAASGGSGTITPTYAAGFVGLVQGGLPYFQTAVIDVVDATPGGINLSRVVGAVASASTEFSVAYAAALAIDGVSSTGSSWCSASTDPAPFLSVLLPADATILSVQVQNPWSSSFATLTGRFRILNAAGTQIFTSGTLAFSSTGEINYSLPSAVSGARRVTLDVLTDNNYPCLGELRIIGNSP
jgi:hypothetical protein